MSDLKTKLTIVLSFGWVELDTSNAYGVKLISSLTALSEFQYYKNPVRLDHLHDNFINIRKGRIADTNVDGPNNDVTDALDIFMDYQSPNFKKSTIYLWGERYPGGIHQIHINQGNFKRNPGWYAENGRGQDGGIVVNTPDGKWKYFFIGFASQAAETDDAGNPAMGDSTPMLLDVIDNEDED